MWIGFGGRQIWFTVDTENALMWLGDQEDLLCLFVPNCRSGLVLVEGVASLENSIGRNEILCQGWHEVYVWEEDPVVLPSYVHGEF